MQPRLRATAIKAGSHRGDEAILFQREIWDKVVKLKDKAHFVAKKAQQITVAIDLHAIHRYPSVIGRIQAAKQMQQCALAATRWPAKRNGLAFNDLEVHALQNRNCAIVIALPYVFGAQDNAKLIAQLPAAGLFY
jgi:hypothetical protein